MNFHSFAIFLLILSSAAQGMILDELDGIIHMHSEQSEAVKRIRQELRNRVIWGAPTAQETTQNNSQNEANSKQTQEDPLYCGAYDLPIQPDTFPRNTQNYLNPIFAIKLQLITPGPPALEIIRAFLIS